MLLTKKMKKQIIGQELLLEKCYDEELKIGGTHAPFSNYFDLKKIGAHYFSIPSGYRTSRPHAESLEEEFVYIIDGEVDLWFNGKIKKMTTGDCIGFPAGTGIGHSFINNSKSVVKLFVAGDRTKSDNKYRFHLAPSLESECGDKWWSDMPVQDLGGHDGMPGKFDQNFIDDSIFTYNGPKNIPDGSYSYPGDTETFTNGICLSRKFGLKSIAVWLEKLPTGKRSSWPHAHSTEEEFVYILDGTPKAWINGELLKLNGGDAVNFEAGSGKAHTLINNSNSEVYYLCVGECDPVGDRIYYPFHPDRNLEVKKEGGLWEECPIKKVKNAKLSIPKK